MGGGCQLTPPHPTRRATVDAVGFALWSLVGIPF